MEADQTIPELVAAAQARAKASRDRISELREDTLAADGGASLHEAIQQLEALAVDIFGVFEARMQHHFKRGPFSRKLKAQLLEAGESTLAERLHHYYLATNVVKHGKGASYRELLDAPSPLIALHPFADTREGASAANTSLVDVTAPGYFDGLTTTILDAYRFLENRQGTARELNT